MKVKLKRGTAEQLDKILANPPEENIYLGVCLITDTQDLFVPCSVYLSQHTRGWVFEGKLTGTAYLEEGEVSFGWPLVVGTSEGDMHYEGIGLSYCGDSQNGVAIPSYVDTNKALIP